MNPNLRRGGIAIAAGTLLFLASCDVNTGIELAKTIFFEPEPSLSKPEVRRQSVEGIINKPTGIPSIHRER